MSCPLCFCALALLVGCDGENEPLTLPPITTEGSERVSLFSGQVMVGEGEATHEVWVGPTAERLPDLLTLAFYVKGGPDERLTLGITDANGRVLIDPNASEFSLNRALSGLGSLSAQVPVASTALPLAPPYKVSVRRQSASLPAEMLTVRVWAKYPRVPGTVPQAQALQVQWILAGGIVPEPQLLQAMERARNIWRQAGIELQEAARSELDNNVKPQVAHLAIDAALGSDSPALKSLLRLSELAVGDGLPLFLVNDVALLPNAELWALSGGIPVPSAVGTDRSGVVVSAALLKRDPLFAGQILAHEIGHALGLFHTTESVVLAPAGGAPLSISDGLADTPACPASADRNADGRLSDAECHKYDAANLMFWGTPSGAVALTEAQADVARRSLLVK